VRRLTRLLTEPLEGEIQVAASPAKGVQVAQTEAGLAITVPDAVEAPHPTTVRLAGPGLAAPTAPAGHAITVQVGANARAVIVLEHTGLAEAATSVAVDAGEGADLTLVSLQDWAPGAVQLAEHDIKAGKDAHVKHVVVTMGGELVRVKTHAALWGEGSRVDLLGLALTAQGQHHEARLRVDHLAPRTTSRATYKNALLQAGARTVWVGDVAIAPTAKGTDTYELNRNLVLAKGARADSVPNLEISTGQIEGAGHASATGRFDEEQLFYLQSRGIPAHLARSMVVHAFFAELIGRIGVPALTDALIAAVDAKLAQTDPDAHADQGGA
jgi:Fe-S cluster assembly protein SufD